MIKRANVDTAEVAKKVEGEKAKAATPKVVTRRGSGDVFKLTREFG